ncbi:MAG: DNA mismatch repair protein MutS, partial [Chloroflexota bacterium]|nr:DNA mismatch repair protein MutS [Chloroflexota bacterium]
MTDLPADRDVARPATDPAATELVPSRRQYLALKGEHPAALLLYRLGDFYETFDEDARVAARDARITLTSRSFGRSGRVPMAGIPHHALNRYLGRLLAAGHTVAIAEQVSPPGRGLVERTITRVLSPGTVADAALLPATENRYLAAIASHGARLGLAWVDVSTGEFATLEIEGSSAVSRLNEELAHLNPAESLLPDAGEEISGLTLPGHRTRLERWHFAPDRARDTLCHHFGAKSLAPYGCADLPAATGAAGAIVAYLTRTNPALLPFLTRLRTEAIGSRVGLDAATRRNLELTRSFGTGGSRGSLLGAIDTTRTAMGARALRRLLGQPLRDLAEIERRQGVIAALVASASDRATLGERLAEIGDLERLLGRITRGQADVGECLALAVALRTVAAVRDLMAGCQARAGASDPSIDDLDPCPDLLTVLETAVEEDAAEGARIRAGFAPPLDAAIEAARETRRWLAGLEQTERERTGIRSLKIGYTKVFGYYIEVTRPNLGLVPPEYRRKQTVAAGERFVTPPLKEAEARLLAADEEIAALERTALLRLAERVTAAAPRLLTTASCLALLDALLALASAAARAGWVAPTVDESERLEIVEGRHPVVEAGLAGEAFIPNSCHLGERSPRQLVVTGPNMGGKSTYLRQVALIVLLAQVGSFVPAKRARIGLVDRIFSRVGAQDDLARGQSTFMVEMVETATILHQATRQSLLILDEVGRGTSTDDGLAIARAVLEDIHGRIGARALFATHYLELAADAERLPAVANLHVAALEREGRVIFLYAVRPGPADRAYGIQVARLAGLPPWVADRAEAVLSDLSQSRPAAPRVETRGVAAMPPRDRLKAPCLEALLLVEEP